METGRAISRQSSVDMITDSVRIGLITNKILWWGLRSTRLFTNNKIFWWGLRSTRLLILNKIFRWGLHSTRLL